MSFRSPRIDGLTVPPDAPGGGNNPAADPIELQASSFWGRWSTPAFLPNAASNAASGPAYACLRPGDRAFVQSENTLYECVDRGTSGGANAVWRMAGSTFGSALFIPQLSNSNGTYRIRPVADGASVEIPWIAPGDLEAVVLAEYLVLPQAGATGAGKTVTLANRWGNTGQDKAANAGNAVLNPLTIGSATDQIVGINVTSVFAGVVAGNVGGFQAISTAVGGTLHVIGLRLRYQQR